jgi:hypothetical protein
MHQAEPNLGAPRDLRTANPVGDLDGLALVVDRLDMATGSRVDVNEPRSPQAETKDAVVIKLAGLFDHGIGDGAQPLEVASLEARQKQRGHDQQIEAAPPASMLNARVARSTAAAASPAVASRRTRVAAIHRASSGAAWSTAHSNAARKLSISTSTSGPESMRRARSPSSMGSRTALLAQAGCRSRTAGISSASSRRPAPYWRSVSSSW